MENILETLQDIGLNSNDPALENNSAYQEVIEGLTQAIDQGLEEGDEFAALVYLLSLPDDQFTILAPPLLNDYKRLMSLPNNKIGLAQTLNASGQTVEDYQATFDKVIEAIDESGPVISQTKKDFLKSIFATIYNALSETEGIAKRIIRIPVEFCKDGAKMPTYANLTDSGMDVYALDDITIAPGETIIVPTGIKVALPPGYELQVRPKSGRSAKTKLRIANTPGTIDAGYRDEIGIIIENVDPPIRKINIDNWEINDPNPVIKFSDIEFGQSYTIGKGEKFAQLVLNEVPKAALYQVESVSAIENDGRKGGFGSTGLQ